MKFVMMAILAGGLLMAGCTQSAGGPGVSSYYDCGASIRLKVDYLPDDQVMVQMNDNEPVTIPAEPFASGTKYMSATHRFWDKGPEAVWTVGRMAPMTCTKVAVPRVM